VGEGRPVEKETLSISECVRDHKEDVKICAQRQWSRLPFWNCLLDGESYATKPMPSASAVCVASVPSGSPVDVPAPPDR